MSQSLCKVYMHLVFSTKHRSPLIADVVRDDLHAYIGGILRELECPSIVIGSVEDHIHILYMHDKDARATKVIERIKSRSSAWMKRQGPAFRSFRWQGGYGLFSVSASRVTAVKAYVLGQRKHHRKMTFQEEFRKFLKEYDIPYDERYVWD